MSVVFGRTTANNTISKTNTTTATITTTYNLVLLRKLPVQPLHFLLVLPPLVPQSTTNYSQ